MVIRHVSRQLYQLRAFRVTGQCLAGCVGIAILTYIGFALQVNLTTISLLYLLIVIPAALYFGFWQASLTSVLAAACLDYFFTQPIFHFYITDPKEWVALGVFQIAAVVISRLSRKELQSSVEAGLNRGGMEQLYELSRNSLLLDLRQAPGPQLVVLIQRIFNVHAVALFDLNQGRQDKAGEWGEGEDNVARECYLSGTANNDLLTGTWRRMLLAGAGPMGALVVRGKLSPPTMDALASLAVMAFDRYQSFEK